MGKISERIKGFNKKDFLLRYNVSDKEWESCQLDWSVLEQVFERHVAMETELEATARYVSERLQALPQVHSIKVRIKDPEHLIEKIIRKRLENPDWDVDYSSYEDRVTDLIGIRALHLFKSEWREIHQFVIDTWAQHEDPKAYIRQGDPHEFVQDLKDAGLKEEAHSFGYRSIHYVIKSQPDKLTRLVELQVRTIFEEGWSEIDHRVRYPRLSNDPNLAVFLNIFNRLAGSADEMGEFTRLLRENADNASENSKKIPELEAKLKKTISDLNISKIEKEKLEGEINQLRRSSEFLSFSSKIPDESVKAFSILNRSNPVFGYGSDLVLGSFGNCKICGKPLDRLTFFNSNPTASQTCTDCSKK